MTILAILAHPDPKSLNHAIAARVRQELAALGHEVILHDLYAEGFDPLLPAAEIPRNGPVDPVVEMHCRELAQAGGIVIVHPNWWGMPPAVLAGWVDRVLRPGRAYEFLETDAGDGVPRGLLRASAALVLNTANTYPQREREVFGDPLERIWKHCVFDLCGVGDVRRRTFTPVATSSELQRKAWLEEAAAMAREAFPAP